MQWAWMSASNTTVAFSCHAHLGAAANRDYNGQVGVYGTQGLPAVANVPGSRDSAVTWVDSSWHFWLFGGEGLDANGLHRIGLLGTLNARFHWSGNHCTSSTIGCSKSVRIWQCPTFHWTVRFTVVKMVLLELAESVPVTANVYVPEFVPRFVGDESPLSPHPAHQQSTSSQASIAARRRRRAGMPHRNMTARTTFPPVPHRFFPSGSASEALEGALL